MPFQRNRVAPTHITRFIESEMNEHWKQSHDVESLRRDFEPLLAEHSVFMAGHGVSHRKKDWVQVGALLTTIVADSDYNPNRPNRLKRTSVRLFEGYNFSPFKGALKDCAEINCLDGADLAIKPEVEAGYLRPFKYPSQDWIALLLSIAANAKDHTNAEINGRASSTLDPCANPCRAKLIGHAGVSGDLLIDTYSFTEGNRITAHNVYRLDELNGLYANIEPPKVSRDLLRG